MNAITHPSPGDGSASMICEKCGPFPAAKLDVRPAGENKVWVMRGVGTVLLAAAVGIFALIWTDRMSEGFHVIVLIGVLVGLNMWRLAREPSRRCPTCGSDKIADGGKPVGKRMLQKWQLASQRPV
jgi:hypothetical protein